MEFFNHFNKMYETCQQERAVDPEDYDAKYWTKSNNYVYPINTFNRIVKYNTQTLHSRLICLRINFLSVLRNRYYLNYHLTFW